MKTYDLTVICGDRKFTVAASGGDSLLAALRGGNAAPESPCGGRGTCRKCTVSVRGTVRPVDGGAPEAVSGEILACRFAPAGDCTVTVPDTGGMVIAAARGVSLPAGGDGIGVAIDLGTTTVAASVYDLKTGELVSSGTAPNCQRPFGADVMSRIDYCRAGGTAELSALIMSQLAAITPADAVREVVIAGNTVMEHIAAGVDPSPIAIPPYSVASYFGDVRKCAAWKNADVYFARCISPYVGGDITAGMLACGLDRRDTPCLFVDMGTNGEIALGSAPDGFVTCATAAGPAFEGAEISCGMAGAPGAIDHVSLAGGELIAHVIGGGEAVGICGSGLIDAVASMLDLGLISESGRLEAPSGDGRFFALDGKPAFRLTEKVYITQQDVRKLQLAKAAIRAGIETLSRSRRYDEIIVAGGFGSFVDIKNAVRLGLLPDVPGVKISQAGNSAALGAALLLDRANRPRLDALAALCSYIDLSTSPDFSAAYIENMGF